MKKIILTVLIISILSAGWSFEFTLKNNISSKLNPYDHIAISCTVTIASSYFINTIGDRFKIKLFKNRYFSFAASAAITYFIGYVKEKYIDHSYQATDINSNIVGIGGAFLIFDVYNLFFIRRQK
jgi:hypothetical protein